MDYPFGLAFDNSGNLYVGNYNNTILRFGTNGSMSVFATNGLDNPGGLAWFGGNLYVANAVNNTIEKFNALGQGSVFTSTNLISFPEELAFDSSGNLYVACNSATPGDRRILKFNQDGVGSVFASGLAGAVGIAIEEIPEPSALLLLGLGLSALALSRRRRQ